TKARQISGLASISSGFALRKSVTIKIRPAFRSGLASTGRARRRPADWAVSMQTSTFSMRSQTRSTPPCSVMSIQLSSLEAPKSRISLSLRLFCQVGTFLRSFGFTSGVSFTKGRAMPTRSNVRSVVADAQDKGREAVDAVSEVRDNLAVAIDKSLKKRPYTTLALTLAAGFLLGAMWAR